ncbi:MAG: hypothetical protein A2Z34_02785 [Planctomycetes bacterium RBG_16_59_8]|nr:MAG: hypothetical protein A2Z34_02785 [Planctomycetes bacterium RBG_16_59_8]
MKNKSFAMALAAFFFACLFSLPPIVFTDPPAGILPTSFYVWQRRWSEDVVNAVRRSVGDADGYQLLVSEIALSPSGALTHTDFHPRWDVLAESGSELTIVIRMDVSVIRMLKRKEHAPVARLIGKIADAAIVAGTHDGATVRGLQIDCDCPESRLDEYGELMTELRGDYATRRLSFTALPSWLDSADFPALARTADYYVLQVHSLRRPETVDTPLTICNTEQAEEDVSRAERIGLPFTVALPTYGYLLIFDEQGQFAGLRAEGDPISLREGFQAHIVLSDHVAIADFVRRMRSRPPRNCRGIVWFRLPVESDELNWSWMTLKAVLDGRTARESCAAEIRSPEPGLYELWVINTGERNIPGKVEIDIDPLPGIRFFHDLLGEFVEIDAIPAGTMRLSGPVPAIGDPVPAAWFRVAAADSSNFPHPVSIEHVRIRQ